MADRKPLKVLPDGGGDSTGLGEFVAADTIGVVDGGTGLSAVGNNQLLTGHSSSTTGALTSQANLTFDGTTLVNTGQGIGVGEAPSTWHSGFDFVQIGGTLALASQPGVQASQAAYIVQNAHYDSDGSWEYQATDEAHRIGMSSGNITFDNAASGTAGNDITWSERMRILPSGGITFNGDTATANALDDYEEGTWTPVVAAGWSSVSYAYQNANYQKVGNVVEAFFFIQFSGTSAGAHVRVSGLPFTAVNESGGALRGGALTYFTTPVDAAGMVLAYVFHNDTEFRLYAGDDGGASAVSNANASLAFLIGSVVYRVS